MRGRINTTGFQEPGTFALLPVGTYEVRLEALKEKQTKSGDPMISIMLVVTSGQSAGLSVWDNIVIPNENSPAIKIMGRTKHFLKCINEPFDGEVEYDTERWVGKHTRIKVDHEAPNDYHKDVRAVVSEYVFTEQKKKSDDIAWDE